MFFKPQVKNQHQWVHEVNMTPLIDVSLVLVLMLLVATPIAFESSIAVRKTSKSAQAAEDKSKAERVEVNVVSEDSVIVNRTTVGRANLVRTLAPLIGESSDQLVVITCADHVSHGAFVSVLDQTKMSGAAQIAVTGK